MNFGHSAHHGTLGLRNEWRFYFTRCYLWYHRHFTSFDRVCRSQHPIRLLWTIYWPFPSQWPLPPRLSVAEIRRDPALVAERRKLMRTLLYAPRWAARDTPLNSLYRIYEVACMGDQNSLMLESQYFWHLHPEWAVKDIPDPHDPDPVRYAVLAGVAESLAESINYRLDMGLTRTGNPGHFEFRPATEEEKVLLKEYPPVWAIHAPPCSGRVLIGHDDSVEDNGTSWGYPAFTKRNIVADVSGMYNLWCGSLSCMLVRCWTKSPFACRFSTNSSPCKVIPRPCSVCRNHTRSPVSTLAGHG